MVGLVLVLQLVVGAPGEGPLRAGDEVRVTAPGLPGGARAVVIDEQGKVELEMYGQVQLAGLELDDARAVLRKHLSRWVRAVESVELALVRHGASVLVTGMVARPGVIVLREPEDLWQALQRAGGVVAGADLRRVTVTHDGARVPVNVWRYLTQEGGAPLPLLRAGDTVFVPADAALPAIEKGQAPWATPEALAGKFFVLGAVARGGIFDVAPGLDLVTALALAGGPAPAADLTRVRVAARGQTAIVDLAAALDGRAPSPELPGAGGVVIYVPAGVAGEDDPLRGGVAVLGAVRGTGRVQLGRAVSLTEVLALAGGTTEKADLQRVRVTHRQRGLVITAQYDVTRFGEDELAGQVRVGPRDGVFVPTALRAQDDVTPWVQVVSGVVLTVSSILVIAGAR